MKPEARVRDVAVALVSLVGVLGGAFPALAQKPAKPVKTAKTAVAATKPTAPKKLSPAWSVAFSPDGKRILVGGYKTITVYDAVSGEKTAEWEVAPDAVRSLTFSMDSARIAAGTGVPAQSGGAVILDAATGKPVRTISGHTDSVEAVAFVQTGENPLLLTAADDESIRITDIASGKLVGKLSEHAGRCLSVAVPVKTTEEAGGEIFATGGSDNMLKVWDARAQRVVVNFDQCGSPVWTVTARPVPGRFIAGSGDGFLRYFGVQKDQDGSAASNGGVVPRTGFLERQHPAHEGGVFAVAVAPNDQFLISGGADRKATLWNMGGGKRKDLLGAGADIWGVAVSPDSKRVATASLDGRTRIYDAEKGTLMLELPASAGAEGEANLAGPVKGLFFTPKAGAGKGLLAQYYPSVELSGRPLITRVDPTIDYQWAPETAVPEIGSENFSARWTGWVEAKEAGNYVFQTQSDDGVRLWINGNLVIDNWTDPGTTEDNSPPIALRAGQVLPIRLEFYQGYGPGATRLLWVPPGQGAQIIPATQLYAKLEPKPAPPELLEELKVKVVPEKQRNKGTGLSGSYFANPALEGKPALLRLDSMVDFQWPDSPGPGLPSDGFSARWAGFLEAPVSGEYTFVTLSDDGVRLWVNNQPMIDNWTNHATIEDRARATVSLVAGQRVPIRIEYYDSNVTGEIRLRWTYPGQPEPQTIPQSRLYPAAKP